MKIFCSADLKRSKDERETACQDSVTGLETTAYVYGIKLSVIASVMA